MVEGTSFEIKNLFFYKDKYTFEESNVYKLELAIHTILFFNCLFYIAKIMFELSLGISRFTNGLDVINMVSLEVIVVSKFIEVAIKANRELDMVYSIEFQDFSYFVSIEDVNAVALAICSFFYPFRIF